LDGDDESNDVLLSIEVNRSELIEPSPAVNLAD
jgi:hypothetical protein